MATNDIGKQHGIEVGKPLAEARLLSPNLTVAEHAPKEDAAALKKLALWCTRYSPWVSDDPSDGIILDITGCAHLRGGEAELALSLMASFKRFNVSCRVSIASTLGAAWAFARHSSDTLTIIESDKTKAALAPYPISALRLDYATTVRVTQVGLKTIGSLASKPRAPLAARYGPALLQRLDQALGYDDETLSPIVPPLKYRVSASLMDPIQHLEAISHSLKALIASLIKQLEKASVGAKAFHLSLYRVDGNTHTVIIKTSALTQDGSLIERLFEEKLKLFSESYDVGFGIDQLVLAAFECETVQHTQARIGEGNKSTRTIALNTLLDRYVNRLGPQAVGHFIPHASHIPERSERLLPIADSPKKISDWDAFLEDLQGDNHLGRPIALLPRPEPITAIAEVPDGPPVLFEWRRLKHRITCAEGPERIAPEWWSRPSNDVEPTRDYYRVEDEDGYRYWLYRQGLYERGETPNWFMHGFFA